MYFSFVRVFVTSGNLRIFVFRFLTTVTRTRWPTATWLWCLAPTCCGDKTMPWRWVLLGQSTTSPESCWISIIWFFLEFRPVALLSLFKCETWMHSWHLALSSIITVLLFQQHTWRYCGPVCPVSLVLLFEFRRLIWPEIVCLATTKSLHKYPFKKNATGPHFFNRD